MNIAPTMQPQPDQLAVCGESRLQRDKFSRSSPFPFTTSRLDVAPHASGAIVTLLARLLGARCTPRPHVSARLLRRPPLAISPEVSFVGASFPPCCPRMALATTPRSLLAQSVSYCDLAGVHRSMLSARAAWKRTYVCLIPRRFRHP